MVTARKGSKPKARPRRQPGPANQSRAAGAPAPASAAATAPFYAPDSGDAAEVRSEMSAHLAEVAHDAGLDRRPDIPEQVRATQAQAVPVDEHATGDHSLARQALAADEAVAPEPGEDLESDIERVRKLRKPFGSSTQKLALAPRAGYHSHWFNGEGGRVDDALANGWAHRKDADGKPVKRAVGRGRDQGVLYAYAMDLPEQFWLEDMAAKHQVANEKMAALKASPFQSKAGQAKASDQGKFYSPVEGREPLEIEKI